MPIKGASESFGDPAFLYSFVASDQLNTFFWFEKQLYLQSGPKGCLWNFLRLLNHDFAACSPIDFAASSPPQQDCQMIADTYFLALELGQKLEWFQWYDSSKFFTQIMPTKLIQEVKGSNVLSKLWYFMFFKIKNFLRFSNIIYFYLRFTSYIHIVWHLKKENVELS